ncbi:hypothetical protein CKAH01_00113 [Colletotrichum kahawae]|uniref:Uncharacterized protein n=1 Tax=Colletotrichum kahawae TaxID=34407 RepID=A0AAD9YWY9_COLKA|nr:hypothetical protein CKAH01_00113 [Colletotrichum kahawae]
MSGRQSSPQDAASHLTPVSFVDYTHLPTCSLAPAAVCLGWPTSQLDPYFPSGLCLPTPSERRSGQSWGNGRLGLSGPKLPVSPGGSLASQGTGRVWSRLDARDWRAGQQLHWPPSNTLRVISISSGLQRGWPADRMHLALLQVRALRYWKLFSMCPGMAEHLNRPDGALLFQRLHFFLTPSIRFGPSELSYQGLCTEKWQLSSPVQPQM